MVFQVPSQGLLQFCDYEFASSVWLRLIRLWVFLKEVCEELDINEMRLVLSVFTNGLLL